MQMKGIAFRGNRQRHQAQPQVLSCWVIWNADPTLERKSRFLISVRFGGYFPVQAPTCRYPPFVSRVISEA